MQETLPILLRLVDPEEFAKYDCMTPTALDYLANYEDASQPMEFQIDATEAGGKPFIYFPAAVETIQLRAIS